jgi:tetratricopeptide (TPR) repeat protein
MVKLKAGDFDQAIELCTGLIYSDQYSPLAWYLLGVALYSLGDGEKAMEALETSLTLRSDNPGALKLLGEIYLKHNDIIRANSCLEQLTALHEGFPGLESYCPE